MSKKYYGNDLIGSLYRYYYYTLLYNNAYQYDAQKLLKNMTAIKTLPYV